MQTLIPEAFTHAVRLPKFPVQDYGNGQINLFISSLNNTYVGTVLLDKLAQNNFNTVYFELSSQLVSTLQQLQQAGLKIKVALEITSPLNGIILDNLRFQESDPEDFDDRTPTADILGFENVGNWSSPDVFEFGAHLNKTQGERSIEINKGASLVNGASLWSDAFAADESGISIANYVNVDVLPNIGNSNGEFQMSLHCPEHYIHNDYVGRLPLNSIPQNAWSRVSLEIPTHIRSNLNTFAPYCRVRFLFINLDGPVLLDNMSFSVDSEENIAYATNNNPNSGSPSAIQVAKNQELVLPAGQHILKLSSNANWAYKSFNFNISPRDGIAMDFKLDGVQVDGWIYQKRIDCQACQEVFITLDLAEEHKLMFQWWEE